MMSEGNWIDSFRAQRRHWTTDRDLGVISTAIQTETVRKYIRWPREGTQSENRKRPREEDRETLAFQGQE